MRLERLRYGSNPDGDSGIPDDLRIAGIEADDVLGSEEESHSNDCAPQAADFSGPRGIFFGQVRIPGSQSPSDQG